ncbi:MAG: NPXTG-anchored protein [Oscillospiraceae bacterium]|nr:NPXTG-anchored protein [Oscillospiraceae bacterium]
MKLRNIFAAAAATVAAAAMAISASAYTATIGYADETWTAQDWATSVEVNGDGTYSITTNCEMENPDTAEMEGIGGAGISVFVVDIAGLGADLGIDGTDEVAKYDTGSLVVSDVTVTSGDTTFDVDNAKLKIGDIEGKGNVRIEIFNKYGPTAVSESYDASVSPIDPSTLVFDGENQLTVTFTLSGLSAEAPSTDAPATDAPATDAGKGSPDTGVEGIAAVAGLAVVAAGAVLVSRKRK